MNKEKIGNAKKVREALESGDTKHWRMEERNKKWVLAFAEALEQQFDYESTIFSFIDFGLADIMTLDEIREASLSTDRIFELLIEYDVLREVSRGEFNEKRYRLVIAKPGKLFTTGGELAEFYKSDINTDIESFRMRLMYRYTTNTLEDILN